MDETSTFRRSICTRRMCVTFAGLPVISGFANRICHHRPAFSDLALMAGSRVASSLMLHLGVEFCADDQDECGDPLALWSANNGIKTRFSPAYFRAGA
jgi:hypothetical protein